jgi:DHA1 family bicyclomycin/chloramphenicol resistance-like MFS transporter
MQNNKNVSNESNVSNDLNIQNETLVNSHFSKKYYVFLMIFLGMMSAFGPFITDMYLPALPSMVNDFSTTESLVQLTLTMGMIGLAVGQIFFGPISQKWGRRPVLLVSMLCFIVGAVSCVFTTDIYAFLACRLVQGIGGAGGIVLSRSIATDCYTGRRLATTMAIIGGINGIAPAFAPVVGGLLANQIGWQGIFWTLTALGVILFVMTLSYRETLAPAQRAKGSILSTFTDYAKILKNGRFNALVMAYGLTMGLLFAYVSSAPFVIQQKFGFNEIAFAIIFGVNSALIGVGSGVALRFKKLEKGILCAAVCALIVAVAQLALVMTNNTFVTYEITSAVLLFLVGIGITSSTSLAMDEGREYTGAAAAIVGAIGFVFGGVVSPLVGYGDIQTTTAILLIIIAILLTATSYSIYRKVKG